MDYVLVALGGMLGAILRFSLGRWIGEHFGTSFPFGTLIINITGSFLLGFTLFIGEGFHLFFNMGFLGAYTTFSTFGYESFILMEKRHHRSAFLYVIGSVFFGIVSAYLGIAAYRFIFL